MSLKATRMNAFRLCPAVLQFRKLLPLWGWRGGGARGVAWWQNTSAVLEINMRYALVGIAPAKEKTVTQSVSL